MSTVLQSDWTLEVRDFRGIEHAVWSPGGVSVLVGPNGSGKTTLLLALELLRSLYLRGVTATVAHAGGGMGLKRVGAASDAPVVLKLSVGGASWEVRLPVQGGLASEAAGEVVMSGGEIVLRRAMFAPEFYVGDTPRPADTDTGRCALRQLVDAEGAGELDELVAVLRGIRVYRHYDLQAVSRPPASDASDQYLHPTGRNLLYVLQQWRSSPVRFGGQFAWVMAQAARAFPGLIEALDITVVGQGVDARVYRPGAGPDDGVPFSFVADGLRVGLLHLAAVAGAKPGSIVALDEVENYLHPFAIRALLQAIEAKAEERDLTVLLTTHSPVVLNEFKRQPEQVYVTELDGRGPRSLDDAFDPDWLAHFAPGELYERLQFGAPPGLDTTPEHG